MKKHELLFLRKASGFKGGIENALIMCVETTEHVRRSEVLTRFKSAVTKWVNTTEEGREAYLDSSEDLNIADLDGHFNDAEFIACLSEEGLHNAAITYSYEDGSEVEYDHHLVNFFVPKPEPQLV
jgi:hypothetical protein